MTNILIADSGSSKTDWRLILSDGSIQQARTVGLNPYYQDQCSIEAELRANLLPNISTVDMTKIYFYGTGCAGQESCDIVRFALQSVFNEAIIEVESDMLGAARGLCGHEVGIACILGTGANNCLYDGQNIIAQVPSLGFWLGDEGSGAYLGKILVTKFLHKELPQDLEEKFVKRYPITRLDVLDNAYRQPFPNRYFAKFSKFLFDNRHHPAAYQIVYEAFGIFFDKYICKHVNFENYKVHFTGSIAFYYNDILRRVASQKGVTLRNVLETPIAGLTLYHQ